LLAGISSLSRRIAGSGATLLQRLRSEPIGLIGDDPSRLALLVPVMDRRAKIDWDAHDLLVDRGAGYPYYPQLLGEAAWNAAGGSEAISLASARQGAAAGGGVHVGAGRRMLPDAARSGNKMATNREARNRRGWASAVCVPSPIRVGG
jgi:hypothetical protein